MRFNTHQRFTELHVDVLITPNMTSLSGFLGLNVHSLNN